MCVQDKKNQEIVRFVNSISDSNAKKTTLIKGHLNGNLLGKGVSITTPYGITRNKTIKNLETRPSFQITKVKLLNLHLKSLNQNLILKTKILKH